jgi:hypothetical protein
VKRRAYRILVGEPEGKRRLKRPRRRWVDDIKMDLRENNLAQVRDHWRALVNTVMNLQVPYNAGKFLNSYITGGSSRKAQLHEARQLVVRI